MLHVAVFFPGWTQGGLLSVSNPQVVAVLSSILKQNSSFIFSVSDATEEFFEYDAEEFLVFLTLLITEGRTPEYSVKGRTEGLHCPPAQSAMPPLHKHECSDKLPQVSNYLHIMLSSWVYRTTSHNAH